MARSLSKKQWKGGIGDFSLPPMGFMSHSVKGWNLVTPYNTEVPVVLMAHEPWSSLDMELGQEWVRDIHITVDFAMKRRNEVLPPLDDVLLAQIFKQTIRAIDVIYSVDSLRAIAKDRPVMLKELEATLGTFRMSRALEALRTTIEWVPLPDAIGKVIRWTNQPFKRISGPGLQDEFMTGINQEVMRLLKRHPGDLIDFLVDLNRELVGPSNSVRYLSNILKDIDTYTVYKLETPYSSDVPDIKASLGRAEGVIAVNTLPAVPMLTSLGGDDATVLEVRYVQNPNPDLPDYPYYVAYGGEWRDIYAAFGDITAGDTGEVGNEWKILKPYTTHNFRGPEDAAKITELGLPVDNYSGGTNYWYLNNELIAIPMDGTGMYSIARIAPETGISWYGTPWSSVIVPSANSSRIVDAYGPSFLSGKAGRMSFNVGYGMARDVKYGTYLSDSTRQKFVKEIWYNLTGLVIDR